MAVTENSLPETVVKYGALGVLGVGLFKITEAVTSYYTAASLALGGIYVGLFGAAVWGIRQITKFFAKKA